MHDEPTIGELIRAINHELEALRQRVEATEARQHRFASSLLVVGVATAAALIGGWIALVNALLLN